MRPKKLIILAGPSGSGKTTVAHKLIEKMPQLAFSISATTRPKRSFEENGKDYHFLSLEEFQQKIENKEFVEYQEVYPGLYYGTLKTELERIWNEENFPLLDIDVLGALNIKENIVPEALAIFVHPVNTDNLRNRLKKRATEDENSFNSRMARAESELNLAPRFDKIVYNDFLDTAVEKAEQYVYQYLLKDLNLEA